jgi:uncharacterized membrane-anchored protein
MQTWVTIILPAAFGAAIQELAYWWQLRHKLSARKYQEQMRSTAYWIVVVAMVIGSGIGTLIWCRGESNGYGLRPLRRRMPWRVQRTRHGQG